ncbi:MAG TPA: hypothetical protein VLU73_10385, partial [Methylococcaceae bacterium]|nr:hypothetical protein [Methylococcaceae bacterium]
PKSRTPGKYLSKIDLAEKPVASDGIRAYAQALLFGPDDRLYVPITGGDPTTTGEVRRYDVRHTNHHYEVIIPSAAQGGQLDAGGWYLTFGKTDSGTLTYRKH